MKALSVTPPWPYALLHCQKTIENRERWNGCSYRGPVAIHASGLPSGVASWWKHRDPERRQTESQWEAMMDFKCLLEDCRDIARDNGIEPTHTTLEDQLNSTGHIVGMVDLVGVVLPRAAVERLPLERLAHFGRESAQAHGAVVGRIYGRGEAELVVSSEQPGAVCLADGERPLTPTEARWWFGGFALVLANPRPLVTPVPCKGALGLWRVPDDVARQVEAQAT